MSAALTMQSIPHGDSTLLAGDSESPLWCADFKGEFRLGESADTATR